MILAFLKDETTGPRDLRRGGWLFIAVLLLNEARGIAVAYEGARMMGWV